VWKEPGSEVGVAVAHELARMSTPASEAFLVRMAKRQNPEVRAAVSEALATRSALGALRARPGAKSVTATARATAPASATSKPAASNPVAVLAALPPAPAGAAPAEMSPALRAVSGLGRREAISWVLDHFGRLDPTELIEVFGSWLASDAARGTAPVSAR